MNHFSNKYVSVMWLVSRGSHAIPSLAALRHVQVSTRRRKKSDEGSWIECGRRIAHDEQRTL